MFRKFTIPFLAVAFLVSPAFVPASMTALSDWAMAKAKHDKSKKSQRVGQNEGKNSTFKAKHDKSKK
jgi:hypothetical protein